MANFIYGKAKEAFFKGEINIESNDFKVCFIQTANYTPNEDADEFLSDIPTLSKVYKSSALSNITSVLGTLDANDLSENYNGSSFEALVLYQHGSTDAESRLISFIDESEGLPFPGTLNPSTIAIQWNNDSTKIITI
jgi:hypothetical protein